MKWWSLLVVALVAVPAAVRAAEQASITRTGWWTRNPAASAPEGGLDVGIGPDGAPLSLAAIEVAAQGAVTRGVLTLKEAGGIAPAGAALVVCTTGDEWTGGGGQSLEDAPSAACDGGAGKVTMTRNAASATWAADVTPLLRDVARDGAASLMVVPVVSDAAPLGFDVQLDPPQLQSEVADEPPAATTTTTTTTSPPSPAPSTTAPPEPPPTTGSDGYDPAVAAAGRTSATTSSTTTIAAPATVDEEAIRAVTEPRPVLRPPAEDDTLPDPWWQLALAVLGVDLLLLGRRLTQWAQSAQREPTGA